MLSKIDFRDADKFSIDKATNWRYTKEMHALVKYPELSGIHISAIVDHLRPGRIGQSAIHKNNELLVKNYAKIDKLDSDTLIISRLSKLAKTIYLLKQAIEYGIDHRQNIYSLEYVDYEMYPELFKKAEELGLKIRHPMIGE